MADAPDTGGILQRLNSSLGGVTAIVAAVVAFNTAVTTCSDQSIARHTTFREAVKGEETFWKGLYDQYLDTFEKAIVDDRPRRRAKLYAISNLANHGIPDFSEYTVNQGAKSEATQRLLAMRRGLIDALQDPQASGADVAAASRIASYLADQQAPPQRQEGAEASEERAEVALAAAGAAPGSLSYQTLVLATGASSGWDVDVFWCQGRDELNDFARAQTVGDILAARSTEGEEIGPGIRLGRIRLRSLPAAAQGRAGTARRGNAILFDSGAGEREAAAAIRALINPGRPGGFRLVRGPQRTSWYLSTYLCPRA